MQYEEEEDEEEEGEDIGGIWQVAKGRDTRGSSCKHRNGEMFNGEETKHPQYRGIWEALDEEDMDEGNAMQLGRGDDEWEEISITIDSGAVDIVGPKGIGSGYPIQPIEA